MLVMDFVWHMKIPTSDSMGDFSLWNLNTSIVVKCGEIFQNMQRLLTEEASAGLLLLSQLPTLAYFNLSCATCVGIFLSAPRCQTMARSSSLGVRRPSTTICSSPP